MEHHIYIDTIDSKDYLSVIRAGLEFIEFGKSVTPASKVFIKPNLTYPEYRPGVMTHPDAVEAAILAIRDYTPHIYLGDSDSGGYNRFSMDEVYDATGIRAIAQKHDAEVVNLSRVPRTSIQFSYHGKQFSLDLPALLVDEVDLLVTMPVPKVHSNTGVSLSFKNQWGCIPENKDRLRLHPYFQHVILEVNRAVKTRCVIIDGQYGLNRNGPMLGDPVELGWVIVSDHIGAAARAGLDLMQVPLKSIPHLRYAERQGMVPGWEQIRLNQSLEPFRDERFYLQRKLTDYPGYLAFHLPFIAYLGYFSPLAGFLHKMLYLVRKPFYDYRKVSGHS
jgi:uncharacterized protein (DUF362 family)